MKTIKHLNVKPLAYKDLRNLLYDGDLLFCSGNYFMSRLIRRLSNSDYSHVGLVYKWNQRIFLLESVEDDGVRIVPLSHYLTNYENSNKEYNGELYLARHKHFSQENETVSVVIGRGSDLLNRNYNIAGLVRILVRIIFKIGRRQKTNEYLCSEFVEHCLSNANIKFSSNGGFIFPEHIAADSNVQFVCKIIK